MAAALTALSAAHGAEWKVVADRTFTGFGHNESVAYDAKENVFYTGNFGPELKPGAKDGTGSLTKVSADGKILQTHVLPAHGEVMNKPKGIWIDGDNLWVTDIDAVWQFNIRTKAGKRLELPTGYANDPALMGGALYISDNQADKVLRVAPADFLDAPAAPKIDVVYSGKGIKPNGLWPGKDGALLMVGFVDKDHPRGIYAMKPGEEPKQLSKDLGVLDGLYQSDDGDIFATDWVTGTLFVWNANDGAKTLVSGIKGPADFGVVKNAQGLLIAQPDLVQGHLRLIQLTKK
jgi:hypothetical protein